MIPAILRALAELVAIALFSTALLVWLAYFEGILR